MSARALLCKQAQGSTWQLYINTQYKQVTILKNAIVVLAMYHYRTCIIPVTAMLQIIVEACMQLCRLQECYFHLQKNLPGGTYYCHVKAGEEKACTVAVSVAVSVATCLYANKALLFGATLRCCTTAPDKGRPCLQPSPTWRIPRLVLRRRPHQRYPRSS